MFSVGSITFWAVKNEMTSETRHKKFKAKSSQKSLSGNERLNSAIVQNLKQKSL